MHEHKDYELSLINISKPRMIVEDLSFEELENFLQKILSNPESYAWVDDKGFVLTVRCRHCPIPVAKYEFSMKELEDYVGKGKDRPQHWGWVQHKDFIYQGRVRDEEESKEG